MQLRMSFEQVTARECLRADVALMRSVHSVYKASNLASNSKKRDIPGRDPCLSSLPWLSRAQGDNANAWALTILEMPAQVLLAIEALCALIAGEHFCCGHFFCTTRLHVDSFMMD